MSKELDEPLGSCRLVRVWTRTGRVTSRALKRAYKSAATPTYRAAHEPDALLR